MQIRTARWWGVGLAALGLACGSEREGAMTPASRTVAPEELAGDRLASALCDHAERCGEIGWEREYPTRGACLNSAGSRASRHLRACSNPLSDTALEGCLDSVASADCGASSSRRLENWTSCQTENLCPSESPESRPAE